MKRILIACDSFKGSASAKEVVSAIANGITNITEQVKVEQCPLADGGEGSLMAIENLIDGERVEVSTVDAFNRPIGAFYLIDYKNNTAYIEMANSVGIELLSSRELNPLQASSYGVGLMMNDAFKKNISKIVLFVGGSATNDMGIGAAQALGVSFLPKPKNNQTLKGEDVNFIENYIIPDYLHSKSILIATDVSNPLYGPKGASMIYGPQKGGDQYQLDILDKAIHSVADLILQKSGIDLQKISGSGAAGGIAGGLAAFAHAQIIPGAEYIFELLKIENKIAKADLLITGEGRMDSQTMNGKLISNLSKIAEKCNVPILAVCGNIELNQDEKAEIGIFDEYSIKKWTNNAPYSHKSTIFHLQEIGKEIARKYLVK
jgi:glycerate kinase